MTAGVSVFAAAAVLVLLWDVSLAGRLVARTRAPGWYRSLSGLAGFLLVPAWLVGVAAGDAETARAVGEVAWLWPLAVALVLAQAIGTGLRRLAPWWLTLPAVAWGAWATWVAAVRWGETVLGGMPTWALLPGLASAHALGPLVGDASLTAPWALLPPLLAPGVGSTGAVRGVVRGGVALLALAALGWAGAAMPRAASELAALHGLGGGVPTERPSRDFRLGLRLLAPVTRPPSAVALRQDLAVADSVGPQLLWVRVAPTASPGTLDSLARALEGHRQGGVVALAVDVVAPAPSAWEARMRRALRPEVDPRGTLHLRLVPTLAGAEGLDAALRGFEVAATRRDTAAWIEVVGAPGVEGEEAQRRRLRHVVAWGSARPWVRGVVLGDAADDHGVTGLRAGPGRLRPVVGDLARMARLYAVEVPAPPVMR